MRKSLKGLAAVALAGILTFGNGCVSLGARPYTSGEKFWSGAAVAAHATDIAVTKYGLDNGWRYESNFIYGEDSGIKRMILIKSAYLGLTYGFGEIDPKHRSLYYQIATVWGFLPAVISLSRILFTSPEDN